jgi:hypothetical protein
VLWSLTKLQDAGCWMQDLGLRIEGLGFRV